MNQADWIEELFAQLEDKPDYVDVVFSTIDNQKFSLVDVSLRDNILQVTLEVDA